MSDLLLDQEDEDEDEDDPITSRVMGHLLAQQRRLFDDCAEAGGLVLVPTRRALQGAELTDALVAAHVLLPEGGEGAGQALFRACGAGADGEAAVLLRREGEAASAVLVAEGDGDGTGGGGAPLQILKEEVCYTESNRRYSVCLVHRRADVRGGAADGAGAPAADAPESVPELLAMLAGDTAQAAALSARLEDVVALALALPLDERSSRSAGGPGLREIAGRLRSTWAVTVRELSAVQGGDFLTETVRTRLAAGVERRMFGVRGVEPALMGAVRRECEGADRHVEGCVSSMRTEVTLADVGFEGQHHDPAALAEVVEEAAEQLRAMVGCVSPSAKLECLRGAWATLAAGSAMAASGSSPQAIAMDELLPLFMLALLRAAPPGLATLHSYIMELSLSNSASKQSERRFHCANVAAAAEYFQLWAGDGVVWRYVEGEGGAGWVQSSGGRRKKKKDPKLNRARSQQASRSELLRRARAVLEEVWPHLKHAHAAVLLADIDAEHGANIAREIARDHRSAASPPPSDGGPGGDGRAGWAEAAAVSSHASLGRVLDVHVAARGAAEADGEEGSPLAFREEALVGEHRQLLVEAAARQSAAWERTQSVQRRWRRNASGGQGGDSRFPSREGTLEVNGGANAAGWCSATLVLQSSGKLSVVFAAPGVETTADGAEGAGGRPRLGTESGNERIPLDPDLSRVAVTYDGAQDWYVTLLSLPLQ